MLDWTEIGNYDWIKRSYAKIETLKGDEGGFGCVFKVKKLQTGELLALKVCRIDEMEKFLICKNEIFNQIHLNHPNVEDIAQLNRC